MKILSCFAFAVSVAILVLSGCNSKGVVAPRSDDTEWRSENFNISATLSEGWKKSDISSPGDTFDRPGDLLQAFFNGAGPYVYIIKVEKDAPLDELPLEDYLNANRAQYTSHEAYELIDECTVDFHGRKFHRFRMKVDGTKGPAAMYAHFFRDGTNLIGVQWTFPIESDGEFIVPAAINQFNESMSINVNSQLNE